MGWNSVIVDGLHEFSESALPRMTLASGVVIVNLTKIIWEMGLSEASLGDDLDCVSCGGKSC